MVPIATRRGGLEVVMGEDIGMIEAGVPPTSKSEMRLQINDQLSALAKRAVPIRGKVFESPHSTALRSLPS